MKIVRETVTVTVGYGMRQLALSRIVQEDQVRIEQSEFSLLSNIWTNVSIGTWGYQK